MIDELEAEIVRDAELIAEAFGSNDPNVRRATFDNFYCTFMEDPKMYATLTPETVAWFKALAAEFEME